MNKKNEQFIEYLCNNSNIDTLSLSFNKISLDNKPNYKYINPTFIELTKNKIEPYNNPLFQKIQFDSYIPIEYWRFTPTNEYLFIGYNTATSFTHSDCYYEDCIFDDIDYDIENFDIGYKKEWIIGEMYENEELEYLYSSFYIRKLSNNFYNLVCFNPFDLTLQSMNFSSFTIDNIYNPFYNLKLLILNLGYPACCSNLEQDLLQKIFY